MNATLLVRGDSKNWDFVAHTLHDHVENGEGSKQRSFCPRLGNALNHRSLPIPWVNFSYWPHARHDARFLHVDFLIIVVVFSPSRVASLEEGDWPRVRVSHMQERPGPRVKSADDTWLGKKFVKRKAACLENWRLLTSADGLKDRVSASWSHPRACIGAMQVSKPCRVRWRAHVRAEP